MYKGPELIKQSSESDRRVKYDPKLIEEWEKTSPPRLGARRPFFKDIDGRRAMNAATGSIRELAGTILEAVTPEDSADEIIELPSQVLFNIEKRSSQKPVFITNTPYRPKPADVS